MIDVGVQADPWQWPMPSQWQQNPWQWHDPWQWANEKYYCFLVLLSPRIMSGMDKIVALLGTMVKLDDGGLQLRDDEFWQDNVDFIKKVSGPEVKIFCELPSTHEPLALRVGDNEGLRDIEVAMKAGMAAVVQAVHNHQADKRGCISWKRLQGIFDGDTSGMFHPCGEENKSRSDYILDKTSWYLTFDGAPDRKKIVEAESLMKKVISDDKIWDCLQINKDVISQTFAEQGVTVSGFKEWFCCSRGVGHVAISVGVVRFARLEDPCFKLYRLRVFVFDHKSSQGLFCEFTERKYVMSKAFTAKFHERTTKAVNAQFGRTMKTFEGPHLTRYRVEEFEGLHLTRYTVEQHGYS